jgi:hypothetical protein
VPFWAFRLEWLTVGWMVIEAVVAVWSSIAAHSPSLIAFGIDSAIELLSALKGGAFRKVVALLVQRALS